jgi:hypothetical protein
MLLRTSGRLTSGRFLSLAGRLWECGVAFVEMKWPVLYPPGRGEYDSQTLLLGAQTLFVPFYNRMRAKYRDEVVMQQDNAPWYTAKIIKNYIRNKKIQIMD